MQLLEKMTYNPAKLYNFEAGYLTENGPADITIFDDKADRIVDTHFASKAANSPFIGEQLKGRLNILSVRDKSFTKQIKTLYRYSYYLPLIFY